MAASASVSLRPAGADDLGLRRALSDRLLPSLVAAMVFLAALALAGAMAAASLAEHWKTGAASLVTVTVPMPGAPRQGTGPADAAPKGTTQADAVAQVLAASPSVASARRLTAADIAGLLKPWLGADAAGLGLQLPAMFEVRLRAGGPDPALDAQLARVAPDSLVERNGQWLARLAELIRSLQACAALALLIVTFVAAAMVGVAPRAGPAARRAAIELVNGLGATDGTIAGQFSRRVSVLVLVGACLGVVLAVPVLLALSHLAAPFATAPGQGQGVDQLNTSALPGLAGAGLARPGVAQAGLAWARLEWASLKSPSLPPLLWGLLACLPIEAAIIAWATAQLTVHGWLRRLP